MIQPTNSRSPSGANGENPRPKNDLPPEILEIVWPAFQIGGLSGMLNFLPLWSFDLNSLLWTSFT
jgi:hypothetical protein